MLIAGGAKHNQIGGDNATDRNIFSGNNYGGIEIVDNETDGNEITGNYIGTDITGNLALPNETGIIVSSLSSGSVIDNNVISGNTTFGLVLTDATDSNFVVNNLIGTGANGTSGIGNGASGIAIGYGATNNTIGDTGQGNTIAHNDAAGILIIDNTTVNNKISSNSIYDNALLGIDIFPEGVNPNDAGDTDTGPNNLMNYPVINTANYNSTTGNTFISGTIDTQNPEHTNIEIFKSEPDPMFNHGEGKTYLGNATPDSSGNWTIVVSGLSATDEITATATDENGNTSEFSLNTLTVAGVEETGFLNTIKVYPNPNQGIFRLSYDFDEPSGIEISILDATGQKIKTIEPSNRNMVDIQDLPAGLYFISIRKNNRLIGIKKN